MAHPYNPECLPTVLGYRPPVELAQALFS